MSGLFVWKEKLQRLYSRHTSLVDRVFQGILAFFVYWMIVKKTGYLEMVSNPLVLLLLTVISAFLPVNFTVVAAVVLLLANIASLSLPIAGVTALILLLMFIFYFRFAGRQAMVLLLMPLMFVLKMPAVIPVVWALVGVPVAILPMACGTLLYFVMEYINGSATLIRGTKGSQVLQLLSMYLQKIFHNKEMWLYMVAIALCFMAVYLIRRCSIDHAWEIAIITGGIVYLVVMVIGDIILDIQAQYMGVILGSIMAVAIGFVVQFFVFTVDYSRTERLQFEDDEYHYYVKAVPKIQVAPQEITYKKINERMDSTLSMYAKENQKEMQREEGKVSHRPGEKGPKRQQVNTSQLTVNEAEEILLTRRLEKELARANKKSSHGPDFK